MTDSIPAESKPIPMVDVTGTSNGEGGGIVKKFTPGMIVVETQEAGPVDAKWCEERESQIENS